MLFQSTGDSLQEKNIEFSSSEFFLGMPAHIFEFFFYRVRFESLKELSSITNLMFCMNLRFDESFEHTFFVNRYVVYETANLKFLAYARCIL